MELEGPSDMLVSLPNSSVTGRGEVNQEVRLWDLIEH